MPQLGIFRITQHICMNQNSSYDTPFILCPDKRHQYPSFGYVQILMLPLEFKRTAHKAVQPANHCAVALLLYSAPLLYTYK